MESTNGSGTSILPVPDGSGSVQEYWNVLCKLLGAVPIVVLPTTMQFRAVHDWIPPAVEDPKYGLVLFPKTVQLLRTAPYAPPPPVAYGIGTLTLLPIIKLLLTVPNAAPPPPEYELLFINTQLQTNAFDDSNAPPPNRIVDVNTSFPHVAPLARVNPFNVAPLFSHAHRTAPGPLVETTSGCP